MNNSKFKEVIYFPSFSAAASYFSKNTPLHKDLNFRFYEEGNVDPAYIHKYFLISAGIHYKKKDIRERMGLGKDCLVMGDSGGHQIAVGTMKWDTKLREDIFNWLETNSDVAINIDIPPRGMYDGKFNEALDFSYDNFKWFNENQSGATKFLNVIQGTDAEQYPLWYNKIKGFDFNGWSVGGGQSSLTRMMYAFATLVAGGEMENKNNIYLHFLGQTRPQDFFIYNIMQRKLDELGLDHIQVMTDSSTPWQFPLYGDIIYGVDYTNLVYKLLYFNKNMNYVDTDKIPCAVNCPACRGVTMADIKNYDTPTRHLLAFHNFFMFQHIMKNVRDLCSANLDLLSYFLNKDMYKVLVSINTMLEDPKNALKVARKHKSLYDKLSNKEKVFSDETLISEFFE